MCFIELMYLLMNKYIKEKGIINLINEYKKYHVVEIFKIIYNNCIDKFSKCAYISINIYLITKSQLLLYEFYKGWMSDIESQKIKIKININEKQKHIENFKKYFFTQYDAVLNNQNNLEY